MRKTILLALATLGAGLAATAAETIPAAATAAKMTPAAATAAETIPTAATAAEVILAAVTAAPALAAAPAPDAVCVNRFRDYDRAVTTFSNTGWGKGPMMASATSRAIQRLAQADCVTDWDDIAMMPTVAAELQGRLAGEHGAAIKPTTLMAGVVTGYAGELQARQFFAAMGYRVRSQGAPFLGRRIFIGPFATEGGLSEATSVAVRAGFVAPYPKFF